jgi:uncharacterized protein (DUF4415 family)
MPVAAKPLKGVGGVLGGLLSPEPPASELLLEPATGPIPAVVAEPATDEQPVAPAAKAKLRHPAHTRIQVRRGRPPGSKTGEGADKEKVTLRLSKELMDEYRDWSWDKRCQLGELVEEALNQYLGRRTRQKSQ